MGHRIRPWRLGSAGCVAYAFPFRLSTLQRTFILKNDFSSFLFNDQIRKGR
jgi:hypothetical protein